MLKAPILKPACADVAAVGRAIDELNDHGVVRADVRLGVRRLLSRGSLRLRGRQRLAIISHKLKGKDVVHGKVEGHRRAWPWERAAGRQSAFNRLQLYSGGMHPVRR